MFRSTPGEPESVLVQPPRGLRAAGWALIISGALLWANEALIRFIAEKLALPKTAVNIKSGHTSRRKVLEVSGGDPSALAALI